MKLKDRAASSGELKLRRKKPGDIAAEIRSGRSFLIVGIYLANIGETYRRHNAINLLSTDGNDIFIKDAIVDTFPIAPYRRDGGW